MTTRIMIVDDDPGLRFTLTDIIESECGYEVHSFPDASRALAADLSLYDVILTDLMMPGQLDGMGLLRTLRTTEHITCPIIMITAHGSERLAVEAMKQGAWDYIKKPFDLDELVIAVRRAAATRAMHHQLRDAAARDALGGDTFVAHSSPMRALLATVERVAPRDITVLITGPTGSGKEVIGSLLHAYSGRADRPLVRFNCAAIPAELAESELFGHEAGAFTGATRSREGYLRRAEGGTLILDEVGELPLDIQSKLLRFFASGEVQPVGANHISHVDVRIVACTNRDLRAEVARGSFRQDLYYRLAVVELQVPGLHERREEIATLVQHFKLKYMKKFGVEEMHIDPEVIARWENQTWPGHVRELENAVARAIAMSVDARITLADVRPAGEVIVEDRVDKTNENMSFRSQMEALERQLIKEAMRAHEGHQTRAAQALGMARTTLIDKLKRHGIYQEKTW